MTMGTAVVTSVPSDSPDDYMSYLALKNKLNGPDAKAYNITAEHVAFPPDFQIISIPGYDGCAAPIACERLKIKSPKDAELLAQAKAEVDFFRALLLICFHSRVISVGHINTIGLLGWI